MDSKSWKHRIDEVTIGNFHPKKSTAISGSIFFHPPTRNPWPIPDPQKISTTPVSGWLSIASLQSLVQTHVRDGTPKALSTGPHNSNNDP